MDHGLPTPPPGYRLIVEIGVGGMGVVYEARQLDPARTVAIKLLRAALPTPERTARFRIEARALARVQHPNVAAIYETGVIQPAQPGQQATPYIVMELIDGLTLTQHARHAHLSTAGRVELIAIIADAVHHAHTRGVIHRDLKPQNVLVSPTAGVKVLDFGLARLTDNDPDSDAPNAEHSTRHTTDGQFLGTAPYMSPEQFEFGASIADTRSDLYALGVMLYELLSGVVPMDLDRCSLAESARRVRDETPVPLGSKDRRYRGDLEHICAKAMHRDPAKRYASARAFAEDLRNHLGARPITARAPTVVYQFARFAKRHPAAAATLGVGGVAGVMGVVLLWGAWRVTEHQRAKTVAQAAVTDAVLAFLTDDVLGAIDPESLPPAGLTMRDVLDRAASELDAGRFSGQPEAERALRSTIGQTYMNLTEYDLAEPQLARALDLAARIDDGGAVELDALNSLAMLMMDQNRLVPADELLARAEAISAAINTPTRATLGMLNNLGALRFRQGRIEDAAEVLTRAERLAHDHLPDAPEALDIASSLSVILGRLGRYPEAIEYARRALDRYIRVRGPEHPHTLTTKSTLAGLLGFDGRYEQAEAMHLEVLGIRLERLGPDHVDTLISRIGLATARINAGRVEEARADAIIAHDGLLAKLGPDHPYTIYAAQTLQRLNELAP